MPVRVFFMTPKEFIEKQKQLYKNLQPCYCPAIQDTVCFNADGFKHLVYDRHRPRSHREKMYRVALVNYIHEVITKAQKARKETFAMPPCCLWVLDWIEVEDRQKRKQKIKMVLRKQGNGKIYFWSIMKKKNNNFSRYQTKKTRP